MWGQWLRSGGMMGDFNNIKDKFSKETQPKLSITGEFFYLDGYYLKTLSGLEKKEESIKIHTKAILQIEEYRDSEKKKIPILFILGIGIERYQNFLKNKIIAAIDVNGLNYILYIIIALFIYQAVMYMLSRQKYLVIITDEETYYIQSSEFKLRDIRETIKY